MKDLEIPSYDDIPDSPMGGEEGKKPGKPDPIIKILNWINYYIKKHKLLLKRVYNIEYRLSRIETNLYSSANQLLKSGSGCASGTLKKAAFIWTHKPLVAADFNILLSHIVNAELKGYIVKVWASSEVQVKLIENQKGYTYAGDCRYDILRMGCFNYSQEAFLAGDSDCIWIMVDDFSQENPLPGKFDFSGNGNPEFFVPFVDMKNWIDQYDHYPAGHCNIEIRGNKSELAITPLLRPDRCVMSSMSATETIPPGGYDQFNIAPWIGMGMTFKQAFCEEKNRLNGIQTPVISANCVQNPPC
ncbi:MAG: hypothetical protein MUC62_07145 [Candidatus Thermoplasmatota archaeon]|nr:hypothetical protein [Candidatus Thermoplasmatota archaeon]